MSSIMKRLKEQRQELFNEFPEYSRRWFFQSLYGSQNYGLATDKSDIDSYIFIFPDICDIALSHESAAKIEFVCKNGEHINAKDVRSLYVLLSKSNPNYLELILSEYVEVNPIYQEEFDELRDICLKHIQLNIVPIAKAIAGMFNTSMKLSNHNGVLANKEYYRCLFYYYTLADIYNGELFSEAINRTNKEDFNLLLDIKDSKEFYLFEDKLDDLNKKKEKCIIMTNEIINREEYTPYSLDKFFISLIKKSLILSMDILDLK